MAEDCSLAASEHGSHPASLERKAEVSHRVDTAVHSVQSPALRTASDPGRAEPSRPKLRSGRHAVLPRRDPCH